jgi:hypothetical protein
LGRTHARKSTLTRYSTQSRTHNARRQRRAMRNRPDDLDGPNEGALTVRCTP